MAERRHWQEVVVHRGVGVKKQWPLVNADTDNCTFNLTTGYVQYKKIHCCDGNARKEVYLLVLVLVLLLPNTHFLLGAFVFDCQSQEIVNEMHRSQSSEPQRVFVSN